MQIFAAVFVCAVASLAFGKVPPGDKCGDSAKVCKKGDFCCPDAANSTFWCCDRDYDCGNQAGGYGCAVYEKRFFVGYEPVNNLTHPGDTCAKGVCKRGDSCCTIGGAWCCDREYECGLDNKNQCSTTVASKYSASYQPYQPGF